MKDKKSFRLVSIGFLSGIIVSGLVFLIINTLFVHQNQLIIYSITPAVVIDTNSNTPAPSSGKIDINQATLFQLVSLPGIGEAKASAIIDFREKYGKFEDISELTFVAGIGNTLLKSIEDLVIIN